MANKRTVDPTGEEASTRIVGIRFTERQLQQIEELCAVRQMSRSELIRQLINNAWQISADPAPF